MQNIGKRGPGKSTQFVIEMNFSEFSWNRIEINTRSPSQRICGFRTTTLNGKEQKKIKPKLPKNIEKISFRDLTLWSLMIACYFC